MKILIAVPPAQYHDKELAQVTAVVDHNKIPYEFASRKQARQKELLVEESLFHSV